VETFRFLSDEEQARMLNAARLLVCADGEVVLHEGEGRQAIYIVRRGTVSVEKEYLGARIPVDELGPGEVFGEMSFLEESAASASVVAQGPVELDVLEGADVQKLLDADRGLAANFYRSLALALSRRLRHLTSEFSSIPFSAG
jgi:CRP-like cAMP-binding protein